MLIRSLLLSSLPAAALPSAAQVPDSNRTALPPQPLAVTHVEIARVVPYHGRSALVQWGDVLELAYAPHVHELGIVVDDGISAFTVLPPGASPDRDRILVADDDGLRVLEYVDDPTDPYFGSTPIAEGSLLEGAISLAAGDWDGDGDLDLAGIPPSGDAVVILRADGAGYESSAFVAPNPTLRAIDAISWDFDEAEELAVLSTWGTEVFDWTGLRLWQRLAPANGEHMLAVIPPNTIEPASPQESLAIVQHGSANWLLSVHDASASVPAMQLGSYGQSGSSTILGLASADCDGDGVSDLVLANEQAERYARFLYNTGDPVPFSIEAEDIEDLPIGPAHAVPQPVAPALGDLDDDGDTDVLVPDDLQAYAVFHDELSMVAGGSGWLVDPPPCPPFELYRVHPEGVVTDWNTELAAEGAVVELDLSNYWSSTLTSTQTHFQVLLWRQAASDGTPNATISVPPRHFLYAIPEEFRAGTHRARIGFELALEPDDPPSAAFANLYYVEVRPLQRLANGVLTNPLETRIGSFTFQTWEDHPQPPEGSKLDYLLDRPGASQCSIATEVVPNVVSFTRYVGGFVPQAHIPPQPLFKMPGIPQPALMIALTIGAN